MLWRNTRLQYGAVAKTFHWVVALLILAQLTVGLIMTNMTPSPKMFQIFALHKSVGMTVLALASLRLLWKLINAYPVPLPNHQVWEKALSKLVHALLYVAMFLMPLTGWIGSSAKGFAVSFFGLFTLPDLVARDDALAHTAWQIHEYAAYTLIGLIGLHFAGAMKHHFIDQDMTLWRMLPWRKIPENE